MAYGKTAEEERRWAERERELSAKYYNVALYPVLVAHHGNWDIYRNSDGYCAAIPTEHGKKIGCRASHFGDMRHLKTVPDLEYV